MGMCILLCCNPCTEDVNIIIEYHTKHREMYRRDRSLITDRGYKLGGGGGEGKSGFTLIRKKRGGVGVVVAVLKGGGNKRIPSSLNVGHFSFCHAEKGNIFPPYYGWGMKNVALS